MINIANVITIGYFIKCGMLEKLLINVEKPILKISVL
jgi:hypothetical protein